MVPLSSGLEVTPRVIQLVDMEEVSAKNVDDQMPDTESPWPGNDIQDNLMFHL